MSPGALPLLSSRAVRAAPSRLDRAFRRALLARLERLEEACIEFVDPLGRERRGVTSAPAERSATVRVRDLRFYRRIALGGSIGAAESWMDGDWEADDLTAVVRALVRNRDALVSLEKGWTRLLRPLRALVHFLRRNTRRGSRRNIEAHYDLGNDFFALLLDPTMMYSCALFERPDQTLEEAQRAKLDRICRLLDLRPGHHLLEIGTGWGSLALHAAERYGCRVTTTTISREQHRLAVERVRAAGLADRVEVLERDYRDLEGSYDRLVSVEMIEAVGHRYYAEFFEACSRLLRPDGKMLMQAIVVRDRYYDECRKEIDFIKRYIFPGSNIPSVAALLEAMAASSDLRLARLDDLTAHYGETLRRWRANFRANLDRIRALGYPERFLRMWEFYLCYCEGGFDEGFTGDVHMLFERERCLPRLP